VNQHIEHLSSELEARGHDPWIIAPVGTLAPSWRPERGRRFEKVTQNLIPMGSAICIPTNGSLAYISVNPRVGIRMHRAIRRMGFDLLHVHEPCTPSVSMMALLMSVSPVVGTFHAALQSSPAYTGLGAIVNRLMTRIDVRIAVSETARAYPARLFPGQFRVIPNGVDVERYAPAAAGEKVPGRICFIGRLDRRKGLPVLLRAFAELRRRQPHVTLTIMGATRRQIVEQSSSGPEREIDLAGVEALGWVTDGEKVEQLAQAELICAPSLAAESFGIVLIEAMAAGVPVVASDLPGYRSVLGDGAIGRLVPPNEPLPLADALEEVLGDPAQRARMTKAGQAAVDELSWSKVTDQILTAYEDALDIGRAGVATGLPRRPWVGGLLLDRISSSI
jgi:phosphatidylinositol alpha-mannosyltransferase